MLTSATCSPSSTRSLRVSKKDKRDIQIRKQLFKNNTLLQGELEDSTKNIVNINKFCIITEYNANIQN